MARKMSKTKALKVLLEDAAISVECLEEQLKEDPGETMTVRALRQLRRAIAAFEEEPAHE